MIDFSQYPLSPAMSRAARNYLGQSQAAAADASDLPVNKLKRFESGKYVPDTAFLTDLRAYFEGQGYKFSDTPAPGEGARASGKLFPAGVVSPSETDGSPVGKKIATTVQHIRIDPALSDDEIGRTLDLIEENEDQVTALLQKPLTQGMFGGLTDGCEAQHGQVLRLLAENGTMFAKLLGRPVTPPPADDSKAEPATHAELMAQTQADMHGAIKADPTAVTQRKAKKTEQPQTLFKAIFG